MWFTILISLSALALCASAAPTTIQSGEANDVGRSLKTHALPHASYHPDSHPSVKTVVPRAPTAVREINNVLADSWNAMGNPYVTSSWTPPSLLTENCLLISTPAEFDERPYWDPLRTARRYLLFDIDDALREHNSQLVWPGQGPRLDFGLPTNMNVLATKYGEFTEKEAATIDESVQKLHRMLPYDIHRWWISINAVDKSLLGSLPQSDPKVQTWLKLLTDAKAMCARYGNPVPAGFNELSVIMEYFKDYADFMAARETMRAVLIKDGKGPIENLFIGETERPKPTEDGQVVVKVKAFGLNRMDIHQREGGYPVPAGVTDILGVEFSGIVHELGPNVANVKEGDEVFGLTYGGAYAEYVLVHSSTLLPRPSNFTWEQLAGLPENWLTAFQALFLVTKVQPGESVLIHAGASGVGIAAIQLARLHGAKRVITTAGSQEKLDFLKGLRHPPTDTINYKTENFSKRVAEITDGKGVDVIVDFIGPDYWEKNLASLALDGRMVLLGLLSGVVVPNVNIGMFIRKRLTVHGSSLRSRSLAYQGDLIQRFSEDCLPLMQKGELEIVIHKVFPWTEIQDAHREMEESRNSGKIIVQIV
ncbi:hypothetical protein FRB99_007906 [Tulasnella sp. 403]|nr:hypothetical protein FRB99_007906 [Tulasnella sp. 403]